MPREKSNFGYEYGIFLATLRRLRESSGRTQTDVADLWGRDQSVVSKCERGERRMDIIEVRDYCSAIGIGLNDFVAALETDLRRTPGKKIISKAK